MKDFPLRVSQGDSGSKERTRANRSGTQEQNRRFKWAFIHVLGGGELEGFYENSWGPKASIPLLTFIPSACPLFHPTVPFLSSRSLYSHRPASPFTAANRPPRSFSLYKQQSLPLLSTNQSIPRVLPRNETSRNRCSSLCEFETFLVFAIFVKYFES